MIQDIAPRRLFNQYEPDRRPADNSYLLLFSGRETLIRMDREGKGDFLRFQDLPAQLQDAYQSAVYLFRIDEQDYFFLEEEKEPETWLRILPEGCMFKKIKDLRFSGILEQHQFFAIHTARQLYSWYKDNRYCGTCGSLTIHSEKERARVCPACRRTIYPRIVPAVIIGITNGDEILLTRYSDRVLPFDALVAGFTEIGETLEQTVEREAMEETGLKVKVTALGSSR